MLLEQVSVNQAILTVGTILTLVLAFYNLRDKAGWGKTPKKFDAIEKRVDNVSAQFDHRFEVLERRVDTLEKNQETGIKESRLIMRGVLEILPEGSPAKRELQSYLLDSR